MPISRPALLLAVLTALPGAAVLAHHSSPSEPAAARKAPKPSASQALPAPGAFAGSQVCADCHGDEHTAWTKDWHSRALSQPKPQFVVGNFADAHFKGESSEAWMSKKAGDYFMRTQGPTGALGTSASIG